MILVEADEAMEAQWEWLWKRLRPLFAVVTKPYVNFAFH